MKQDFVSLGVSFEGVIVLLYVACSTLAALLGGGSVPDLPMTLVLMLSPNR